MVARALRSGARVVGGLALSVVAACNGAAPPPHGAPVLLGVYWVAGDATSPVWSPDGNPLSGLLPAAPPFVSEIDFVFDRRLDGTRIEDTFTQDGVVMTRPMTDPPVQVTWPERASAQTPFSYTVQYNSVARFGSNTSYVLLRPSVPGLPSGETVTFDLEGNRLANDYGEGLASPSSVSVLTTALSVSVSAPAAAVAGTYQLPLAFSNRMSTPLAHHDAVHVRGAGALDVPFALVADANLASRWYIGPADCLGRWPPNTTFTVTVDPGIPDAFGGKLAMGATATFETSAGAEATAADCGVVASDDAGVDAGAGGTEAGAAGVDASPDVTSADAGGVDAGASSDVAPPDAGAADAGASADAAAETGVDAASESPASAPDAELTDATASS